jgi:hypothetical protein
MKGIEGFGKGIFLQGHTYEVNVISHETVCPDTQLVLMAIPFKKFEIEDVIFFCLEDRLSIITPLGYMVGEARRYHSC